MQKLQIILITLMVFYLSCSFLVSCKQTIQKTSSNSGTIKLGFIKPNQLIKNSIGPNISHEYVVATQKDNFIKVNIKQVGIDISLKWTNFSRKEIKEVNFQPGIYGVETLIDISPSGGDYTLEIKPVNKDISTGSYEIEMQALHNATEEDKKQLQAENAYIEANTLHLEAEATSKNKAIEKYLLSAQLFASLGMREKSTDSHLGIAETYYNLGENEKALDIYFKCHKIFQELDNQAKLGKTKNQIGLVYWVMGDLQQALNYYNEALKILRETRFISEEGQTINNIGSVYYSLSDYQNALDYSLMALNINRAVGDIDGEASTLHNIGSIYDDVGDQEKALYYYNLSIPKSIEAGQGGESSTLHMMGRCYNNKGDYQKALEVYKKSLPLFQNQGARRAEGLTLHHMGAINAYLGNKDLALELFDQALKIHKEVKDKVGESITLVGIAKIYDSNGDRRKALELIVKALKLAKEIGDKDIEPSALYELAKVYRNNGNLKEAKNNIIKAINIVETQRTKLDSQKIRSSYFATRQDYYTFYINLLMETKLPDQVALALEVNERAKCRSLIEGFVESNAKINEDINPTLINKEQELQRLLDYKQQNQMQLLNSEHTAEQENIAKSEIENITAQLTQLEAQIKKQSAKYTSLRYPTAFTLKDIQAVLDDDHLLVEYNLGNEHSYVWVVSNKNILSFSLPRKEIIEEKIKEFITNITARSVKKDFEKQSAYKERITKAELDFPKVARELSSLILNKIEKLVTGKKLLIVGDGALNYIPFGVLPVSSQPLIYSNEIVALPSASAIIVMRKELKNNKLPSQKLAIMADPVFDKNDNRLKNIASEKDELAFIDQQANEQASRSAFDLGYERSNKFPRLIYTLQEAKKISGLLTPTESKAFLGTQANIKNLKNLSDYKYIHIATHGFINSTHPELSGIVLSLYDEKGNNEVGFLSAYEVYNLHFSADLMVLSACSTGLGKNVRGEGIVGLTQGFLYAGCKRILVSLWNVNDKATSEFMELFYKKILNESKSPSAALRETQIEMSKKSEWSSPYFWGAFTLQGEYRE